VQLYKNEVYHIPSLAYLDQEGSTCYLAFSRIAANHFVLGNTFLFNFYTVYDVENRKVGIIPHIWSKGMITTTGVSEPPDDPQDPLSPGGNNGNKMLPVWAIVVIVIAGLVLLIGIAVFSFIRYRRGKSHKTPGEGVINEEILED
jgi:hypothetical protein